MICGVAALGKDMDVVIILEIDVVILLVSAIVAVEVNILVFDMYPTVIFVIVFCLLWFFLEVAALTENFSLIAFQDDF